MYKKMWVLFFLIFSCITHTEIQDGNVVAGALAVRNASFRSVNINGYTILGDKTLYIDFQSKKAWTRPIFGQFKKGHQGYSLSENDLNALYTEGNTFILQTASGQKIYIEVPMVDFDKPYEEYGGGFNMRHILGCDLRMEPLEFDIYIESHWIFGQKVFVGSRFKQAQDNF